MSQKRSNKKTAERVIIRKFLQAANIQIRSHCLRAARPPFPDFLCRLANGTQIAFELTEAVDPRRVRSAQFAKAARSQMYDHYQNILPRNRTKLGKALADALISFHFADDITEAKFKQLLPKLFDILLGCSSNMQGNIAKDLLPSGVNRIDVVRKQDMIGPLFNPRGPALFVRDISVAHIMKKFSKKYKCDCPIELLVHSKTHPLPPDQLWIDSVRKLLVQKIDQSPFQKVWIFDYMTSTIRYAYP